MNVAELKNTILKKGWHFRFKSPNPLKKDSFGWKNLEMVDKEYGGFEAYLKKIAESQKLNALNIECKAKNGSGWLNKGLFLVETEPIENVVNIDKEVKTDSTNSTTPVTEVNEVKEVKETKQTPITHTPPMEDVKTIIENASMKTELQFLKAENARLAESNKKLDHKNEELFNEVSKLSRELSTNTAKSELDFRKKEIELLQGQKSGLSGIVDEVKNMDPKTLGMIISVFQPNNQVVKTMLTGDNNNGGGENSSLNGPKHENSEVQDYIEQHIYPMLTSAPAGAVGMLGGLIEYFTKNDIGLQHLALAYKKFLPNAEADLKGTGGSNEENLDEDK